MDNRITESMNSQMFKTLKNKDRHQLTKGKRMLYSGPRHHLITYDVTNQKKVML